MKDLTLEHLKECVTYSPDTGRMSWRVRPVTHFKTERAFNIWNTRFSGHSASDKTCSGGYLRLMVSGRHYRVHQLAWLYVYGEFPAAIDHINGDRADNRINNLRNCTQLDNMKNTKRSSTNTSGVTGVGWESRRGHWIANIEANYEKVYLGSFNRKEDAIDARKRAEVKYGFHGNHGRGEMVCLSSL